MKKEPPEIFIDTNVWFSSLYGSINSEKLIDAHIKGKIMAAMSRQVLVETVRNFKEKLPNAILIFEKLVKENPPVINKNPEKISSSVKNLVHPKDQIILQSAVDAKIKIFVTGNTKHFDKNQIEKRLKIKILTPKQAVNELRL